MLSFFIPRDRWKWDPAKGVPDKKVIKVQRATLRSGSDDVKRRLLEHIVDLADKSVEIQSALCDGKVTADVCGCFLSGSAMVQEAAANTLAALCDGHPGNCAAVVAAREPARHHGSPQQPLSHALKLLQDASSTKHLALAAAGLLDALGPCESGALVQHLHHPGCLGKLIAQLRGWSSASCSAGTPPPACAQLLRLLQVVLGVLQVAASAGGAATCRELFRAGVLGVLLEMARDHQGQLGPAVQLSATAADGEGGSGGGCGGHAAVLRDALNLLFVMLSQVPAHRLKLQEAGGVAGLLRVLRNLRLPWSVRLQAVAALTAAAASPAVAEDVRVQGLETVVRMLDAFVSGRAVVGAPGAVGTPQRAAAPAGPSAAAGGSAAFLAPPPSPPSPAFGSPLAAAAAAAGSDSEPRTSTVVEQLLGLVDAVAGAADAGELLEEARLRVLLAALNGGLADFSGGGYRVATAAAQVLFRLSSRAGAPLPAALAGPGVTVPLGKLVSRALDYAAASSGRDAQVLHGAWCAEGLLGKVMDAEQRRGESQQAGVVSGGMLSQGVRLLDASAPVLLVAVGAAPPPYAASAASVWQTPGMQPDEGLRTDGRAYLAKERVASDLRSSVPLLLALLGDLAQRPAHQPALRDMGAVEAARRLLPWRQVQWRVKRLLHLLGELEVEYKPFPAYGCGPLLAAVLGSQRLDPRPFLEAGVDAHLLLRLGDDHLRQRLGLDEVAVLKVSRLRDAYSLFAAMDAVDGRVDGCVTAPDMETYLTANGSLRQREAQELCEGTFRELQVLPGEPVNFMQFLQVYPSLEGELEAVMPRRQAAGRGPPGAAAGGGGGGAAGEVNYGGGVGGSGAGPSWVAAAAAPVGGMSAAGDGGAEGAAARAWKRRRVGGEEA